MDLTLDAEAYIQLNRAFMGGFTHANANYSNKILNNVSSVDFTSAYPSVMLSEKFPMSRFKLIQIESEEQLSEYCKKYALVFDIKFHNIRSAIPTENYISSSKCLELKSPVINNGRVHSAEVLATTLTDVDFDIMEQCYEWDYIELANVRRAYKNYLPKSIIKPERAGL